MVLKETKPGVVVKLEQEVLVFAVEFAGKEETIRAWICDVKLDKEIAKTIHNIKDMLHRPPNNK